MVYLVKEVQQSHVGTGGEAAQTFDIEIPNDCRVAGYSWMVDGVANPIANTMQYINKVKVAGKDWGTQTINTIFSSAALTEGSNIASLHGATHLRWTVQSNAVTDNQFFLLIRFWRN